MLMPCLVAVFDILLLSPRAQAVRTTRLAVVPGLQGEPISGLEKPPLALVWLGTLRGAWVARMGGLLAAVMPVTMAEMVSLGVLAGLEMLLVALVKWCLGGNELPLWSP